jgi:glycosyltransferase involved in cell wall biosynthesis
MFFNLQDLWPENVEEVLGIRFKPLSWYLGKIVDKIYAGSDKILCTSRGFVKNLTQRGVPEEKLVFWPQFCLEPDLSGKEKPEVYGDDTFNIVFAGNLGDAQGLDLMVEAAGQLRGSGIRWYLVGDGRAKERLQKMVADSGLEEDVVFVGRVSEDEANRYVHFADCAYLSFKNNKIFNMMIPAKLQTYLACGTPVLAAAGGETAQLITSSGCGIVAEQECAALAAAAREAAAMSKEQRSEMAAAARKYYDGNFVMDTLVEELLELMENETKKQE